MPMLTLSVCLGSFLVLSSGADPAATIDATSLGLQVREIVPVGDGAIAFTTSEPLHGQDLNGDGALTDWFVHVHDAATGTTELLDVPLAFGDPLAGGERLLGFVARESAAGQDLNGDGDTSDRIAALHDLATGETRTLGLAVTDLAANQSAVLPIDDVALVVVSEFSQGVVDLDGSPILSSVLFVHDASTGASVNTGLRIAVSAGTPGIVRGAGRAAFAVPEMGIEDLNGDGDPFDEVLFVYDAATGDVVNLSVAVEARWLFDVSDRRVLFAAFESGETGDLNGDWDTQDLVLQTVELATGQHDVLPITLQDPFSSFYRPVVGEDWVAVFASEAEADTDLNGDGDVADRVPRFVQRRTATVRGARLAVSSPDAIETSTARWALVASESDSGGRDLNGDGDALDRVPFLFDLRATSTEVLPRASDGRLAGNEHLLVFAVPEADQGGTDLDGDGLTQDSVYAVYDVAGGELGVSRHVVAESFFHPFAVLTGDYAGFHVHETAVSGSLNGDADVLDRVFFVFDGACGRFLSTGLSGGVSTPGLGNRFTAFDGGFAFSVPEGSEGADLNGGGDVADDVVHVVDVR